MPPARPARPARPRTPQADQPEVVEPLWMLKAVAAVFAVGLLCAYITLCLFFYSTQWEFVLHPSRTVAQTPASQQLAFENVRFGDDIAGKPQLTGWWIPADLPSDPTVLLLHGQNGSMSDALPFAKALHDARLNVLLFDYRGYGLSEGRHPTQRLMGEDARDALRFLTETKKVPLARTLAFGNGLGASLATELCRQHPGIAGLILLDADGDTASRVQADQRSRVVPISLLFHERFPLADPLHTLRTPKLLISFTKGAPPEFALRAGEPKLTTELAPDAGLGAITAAIRRFLDTYTGSSVPALLPSH